MSSDAFADHMALLQLTGDHPKARLLAALLAESADRGLHKSALADQSGIARSTVYRHLDDLVDLGVVDETPTADGYHVYSLNTDSQLATRLGQLDWELVDACAE